jgi:diguanylate cyclase (GGDEF)-like protein
MHGERVAVLLCSSWHSVGPALVVGVASADMPAWGDEPVFAAALASQFAFDAGDRMIQALAAGLQRTLPDAELIARVGGDEFAVLIGGSADAHVVSRLRRGLAGLQSATGIEVEASIGVAACPPCASLEDALRAADARLFVAKPGARRAAIDP